MKRDKRLVDRSRRPQRELRENIRLRVGRRDAGGNGEIPPVAGAPDLADASSPPEPPREEPGPAQAACQETPAAAAGEPGAAGPDSAADCETAQENPAPSETDGPPDGADADAAARSADAPAPAVLSPEDSAARFPAPPYVGRKTKNPKKSMKARPAPKRRALGPAVIWAGLAAAALAVFLMSLPPRPASGSPPDHFQGWAVTLDGRELGVVADPTAARLAIEEVYDGLESQLGLPVDRSAVIGFMPVLTEERYLCAIDALRDAVSRNIRVSVAAWSIFVNDRRAVTVASQADAADVLLQVVLPYVAGAPEGEIRENVGFLEKVEARMEFVPPGVITPASDAARTLTMGDGVQDNWYTVEAGDSLAKIARRFGVEVEDIRRSNPSVADTDVIHPGDQLNVVLPRSWINVLYTQTQSSEETMPYRTVTIEDSKLYTSQRKVTQKGVDGLQYVVSRVSFINGMPSDREILLQSVLDAPVDEIVREGTRQLPPIVQQAQAGLLPLPLKKGTYVISSYFGMRTLNGVTRMHKGVDLAADTGTTIYASQKGTVTYAGWASGYGLVVYIDHGDGVQTRYGHCSKLLVKKGDHVDQGEPIAKVGSTGVSTGPHVHFEVRINGMAVNPLG